MIMKYILSEHLNWKVVGTAEQCPHKSIKRPTSVKPLLYPLQKWTPVCSMRCLLNARFVASRDGIRDSVWNRPIQSGGVRTPGAQYTRGGIQSLRRSIPTGMERMDQTAFPDVSLAGIDDRKE